MSLLAAPWKLATIGAGVVALGLGGALVVEKLENRQLTEANGKLDARINDRSTGYVARLAQAHTNVETLKVQLEQQNEAYRLKAEADAAKLRDSEQKLAATTADRDKARQQANSFLATKPRGDTLEQRVLDVDSRFLEILK